MGDKLEAIAQSKEAEQVIRQEKLREKAQEAKQEEAGKEKVEAKAEPKAEAKAEPKAEVKAEPKAEVKAEPKAEVKAEAKKAAGKEEKRKKLALERVYTVPLSKAYEKPRSHRARVAVSLLRQFVARHAKASSLDSVSIDSQVNSMVLARGSRNPPKKVRVLVQKDEEGKVMATLAA